MDSVAADLAHRLARDAEAVCRHYLSSGRRAGNYWLVGDTGNNPGRSLYVRLRGPDSGKGAAGKWTDAATGEHGDLLDLIAANRGLDSPHEALEEARSFLGLVRPARSREPLAPGGIARGRAAPVRDGRTGRGHASRRPTCAHAASRRHGTRARFASTRAATTVPTRASTPARTAWPALIAAVTDLAGTITGAHRTWLDPSGQAKAPVATPRRAMGHLLGNAVRFGAARDVMAAGEGIETMLSLRTITPDLPMVAALSANHLAALVLPPTLRRLYVVQDNDPAGRWAAQALTDRARRGGIEALVLVPALGDSQRRPAAARHRGARGGGCGCSSSRRTWRGSGAGRQRRESDMTGLRPAVPRAAIG